MTQRQSRTSLDLVLAAISEPTRRAILELVVDEPGLSTADLAARSPTITRWGVMKHLDVLRAAGLVQTMATGRMRRHYPELAALAPLRSWLRDRGVEPAS